MELECTRTLHETLLMPVLMYGNKTMLPFEKKRSRIRAVQMDNFRGLLGIWSFDQVTNVWIRKLCGVTKGDRQKN